MLGGYLEFFMKPALADTYITLKRGLEELIQMKVRVDHFFPVQKSDEYEFLEMICFRLIS